MQPHVGGRALGEGAWTQPDVAADRASAHAVSGRLGLDTEFLPEGRYRPLLCLVQVVVEDEVWVLDPLEGFDPEPLAGVLADPEIEILVHAGRQDVAILRREWSTPVTNVFDTQVAAGFAGFSAQAGYNGLLHDVLRIRLPKTASFYALGRPAADRRAGPLRPRRRRAPAAAGRRDPPPPGGDRPGRVGSRGVPRGRAGVRRARPGGGLAAAAAGHRARRPRAGGRPRAGRVARADGRAREPAGRRRAARPDGGRLAKRTPAGRKELAQIRGISPDVVRRRGDDILAAVLRGRAAEPIRLDEATGTRPTAGRPRDRARRGARPGPRAGGRARL